MGYYLSDILPMRSKEDYWNILKTIEHIKSKTDLDNPFDQESLNKMEELFKDVIELWGKEG